MQALRVILGKVKFEPVQFFSMCRLRILKSDHIFLYLVSELVREPRDKVRVGIV